ncbi:Protein of unknown function [Cotesia congregata]|uniref:Uncharacterized protein n=1 Tax=Cotesia congregata TaxID=51543 RepID=A0A8J2MNL7_COTCN|nr:Protein of unknown function [Cotesia congregata]
MLLLRSYKKYKVGPIPKLEKIVGGSHFIKEFKFGASPIFGSGQIESQFPSTAELRSQNFAQLIESAHPEFASYGARLKSFESWPC